MYYNFTSILTILLRLFSKAQNSIFIDFANSNDDHNIVIAISSSIHYRNEYRIYQHGEFSFYPINLAMCSRRGCNIIPKFFR